MEREERGAKEETQDLKEVKISVIIPAYNAEKFLRETLDSVLKQDFRDFEIILIDDGSEDGTGEILAEYETRYPEVFRCFSQENAGQSATRNRALAYVRGEYIAFVDADDLLRRDYLKRLYLACQEKDAQIAVAGYKKFDSDTHRIVYSRNPVDWEVDFGGGYRHLFQYSPWGKLLRTDFVKEYGFRFSEGEQLEDGPYGVMTHILANRVVALDYFGYWYRVHEASTMGGVRKKDSKPKVPYRGIEEAIVKVREFRQDPGTDQMLEYCILKVLAGLTTSMYKSCDKQTRKEVCDYCYRILDKYFPHAAKNPYLSPFCLKKLPLVHRLAVYLFVKAYRYKVLYPFSAVVSKVI